MSFIGVIADEKNEKFIKKCLIEQLKVSEISIIIINEKNIENIKNIRFETLIINRKFKNLEGLRKILANVKYIVINTDIIKNLYILKDLELTVITYGFNTRATITASSISDENSLICLQRTINNINGKKIEMQEIKISETEDINALMAIVATMIIYKDNL